MPRKTKVMDIEPEIEASELEPEPETEIEAEGNHTHTLIFLHGLGDSGKSWVQKFYTGSPLKIGHLKIVLPTA